MTNRSAGLLLVLVALVFATCTGCAHVRVYPDSTMDVYVLGQAGVQLQRHGPSAMSCKLPPGAMLAAPGAPHPPGTVCSAVKPEGTTLTVFGGPLSEGWFRILENVAVGVVKCFIPGVPDVDLPDVFGGGDDD